MGVGDGEESTIFLLLHKIEKQRRRMEFAKTSHMTFWKGLYELFTGNIIVFFAVICGDPSNLYDHLMGYSCSIGNFFC